jgi:hypothetical protein
MDGPAQTPARLRPWPRCSCGELIQVSTGRCVACDFPPGASGRIIADWPAPDDGTADA